MSPSALNPTSEVIKVVCSMSLSEMPCDVKALEQRIIETNCLTLNDTEGREEKAGVSNRCLIFDDTDGKVGITEYGEQERVSGEDALALRACAGSLL